MSTMSSENPMNWVKCYLADARSSINGYFAGKDACHVLLFSAGTTLAGLWLFHNIRDIDSTRAQGRLSTMSSENPMNWVKCYLADARSSINGYFAGKDACHVLLFSAGTTLAGLWLFHNIRDIDLLQEKIKNRIFVIARKIPAIRNKIQNELDKVQDDFKKESVNRHKGIGYITQLPAKSCSNEHIIDQVTKYLELGEYDWESGFVSGAVYHQDPKLLDLVTRVYGLSSYTNPLHSDVFPGVCKMDAEVVRMACNIFHGDSNSCGSVTTGGTESILMAIKACRDYALESKGITNPVVVLPKTAHPAFNKGSKYFGIRLKFVPVDPETLVLVASAPCYPYGTIDPVPEIAALGLKYNIPVHVDMCLGGFVIPFMEEAGFPLDHACDFAVPGVTSISADTHKVGLHTFLLCVLVPPHQVSSLIF
ncbi:hypothetical protein B566_EDAN014665 [Ephemera danica]|nr:hypothetical protein B566_EDAN014665 [Ephemera danica]